MTPQMMDQMQKHLSDPATADMISTFVQTMKPEDLAGILKQSGMAVTPEQVQALSDCCSACFDSMAFSSSAELYRTAQAADVILH